MEWTKYWNARISFFLKNGSVHKLYKEYKDKLVKKYPLAHSAPFVIENMKCVFSKYFEYFLVYSLELILSKQAGSGSLYLLATITSSSLHVLSVCWRIWNSSSTERSFMVWLIMKRLVILTTCGRRSAYGSVRFCSKWRHGARRRMEVWRCEDPCKH